MQQDWWTGEYQGQGDGLGRLRPSKSMTGLGERVSGSAASVFFLFFRAFFSGSSLGSLAALLKLFFLVRLADPCDDPLTKKPSLLSLARFCFLRFRVLFSSPSVVGGGWLSSWTESSVVLEVSMADSFWSPRSEAANWTMVLSDL